MRYEIIGSGNPLLDLGSFYLSYLDFPMKRRFFIFVLIGILLCLIKQIPAYGENILRGGMNLIKVKGGCFEMGDSFGDGLSIEKPLHKVCVDDYSLGQHEVTQREWKSIMGSNPSLYYKCGADCPVEHVLYAEVQEFIKKLNDKTGLNFRLPTEAEWEYAARERGKKLKWSGTNKEEELDDYAWYAKNSDKKTHPVMLKKPNALGLYDMSGNVWEWVQDWFDPDYYSKSPVLNPKGVKNGTSRLGRGGSWLLDARDVRATLRRMARPRIKTNTLGLRIALSR